MVEVLQEAALMVPSILAVSSWLAGRLQKKTAPAAGSRGIKPEALSEMRQSRATTLAKEHFALVKDHKRSFVSAKYRDVLLRKDGVGSLRLFTLTRPRKMDCPRCPCRHKYDSRIYEVDTLAEDREQVGAFIKEHNNLTSS
jgi:hypothetical protein